MAYEAINVLQTPITQFYYAETIYENECTVRTHEPTLLRKNSDVQAIDVHIWQFNVLAQNTSVRERIVLESIGYL